MELRHLRYFVALADELHFGRAAETAYVAQSTLSQQIQAFEEEMGVTFFERSPGGVELTEAGRTFRPYAERVLQEARRAESIARAARDGLAGLLSITYEATAMRSGLPPIIKAFRENRPHGELDLAEQTTREQVNALRAEEADAGFLFLPINESDRDAVPLHELEGEPHVIWARGGAPRIHDAYVRACHDAGFTPRIIQDIERGESFLGLVEAGLGVSIAHASNLQIQRPGVRYAKIVEPTVPLTLGLVHRREEDSPLLDRFLETVEEKKGAFESYFP
ncbi:MAG: LysR family transcriptional regulator [Bacteroidetes bacterium QH_1_61_8]|nr:MAG: LysR family transcriptional regulator [Bacteroidetes bacterium QH_1_61_8]